MDMLPIDHHIISVRSTSVHLEKKVSKRWAFVRDGLSVAVPNALASIIKIPPTRPPDPSAISYNDLPLSIDDAQKITRLITVMGENGKVALLFKYQKELRQIGREIEHVHPLKFVSVILSNPYLKSCMKEVHKDYFKWTNFMDGLGNGLTSQNKQGRVSIYLNDFANAFGVSLEKLQQFVDKQEWENMLIFLINA